MLKRSSDNLNIHLYKALCLYAICKYKEAKKEALKGPEKPLQIRLLYHISQKMQDDSALMSYHHKIGDEEED